MGKVDVGVRLGMWVRLDMSVRLGVWVRLGVGISSLIMQSS